MSPRISRRQLLGAGAKATLGLSLYSPLRTFAGEFFVESAEAQTPRRAGRFAQAFARLDEFIERHMREVGAPGMTLALADREGTLRVATYGFADTKTGTRVRAETMFEIGSISKSFVAVALLQMRDEGKIDLHKPVAEYLPWLKVGFPHGTVTTHHLLSHTSGLPGVPLLPESISGRLETGLAPGEQFVYSNIGYFILGLLIEAIDRRTLADSLRARVLRPLDMSASAPVITNELRPRMAVGYAPLHEDRPFPLRGPLAEAAWIEVDTAAGSVASTAADMAAYLRMLLRRGEGPRSRVLSEESFAMLVKPVIKAPFRGEDASYTYGLWMSEIEGRTQLRHTGGMVAFSSMMDVDLTTGIAGFASVNANLAGYRPLAVVKHALELLRASLAGKDLPAPPPPPDTPAQLKNAAEYAGTFTSPTGRKLVLANEGNRLVLLHKGQRLALERSGGRDSFIVRHPDFELFRLVFGREGDAVTEAAHGADWYTNERYKGPRTFEHPKEWEAFVGRYRHDSPWYGSFRVVLRKGQLWLDGEQRIYAEGANVFRTVAPGARSPEWISFEEVVGGRALRVNFSNVEFYRAFTP